MGVLKGRVVDKQNNTTIPFANVVIWDTSIGTVTDSAGNFSFFGLKPGFYQVQASSIGFKTFVSDAVLVTNAKEGYIDILLDPLVVDIEEITIKPSPYRKTVESPVSLISIGIDEIERNPGSNRDISKVIQSFPGVASSVNFRNDIIVRGGGPSENVFYLDGIEIPYLNHFSTQGASGGPVGIINVDFIRGVDFYSGAFNAPHGDAMSSVLDFKQKDGNTNKFKYRATLGASDLAFTADGPVSRKTTLIASVRRSYLKLIFSALDLPFLPTYNDFQFKTKTKIDEKNEISFIGIGAIDKLDLNTDANETEEQQYILGFLPVNKQWSYTIGTVYKHYRDKSYDTYVLSMNNLNNKAYKYQDNIEEPELLILDFESTERETKFRYENNYRSDTGYKINFGTDFQHARYFNSTFSKDFVNNEPITIDYESTLNVFKYGIFGQVSKNYINERLGLSFGIRADGNSYSSEMSNPFKQLSPRLSASYKLNPQTSINFNIGRYNQLPAYTTLGYRDSRSNLVNKENGLKYINVIHYVAGIEFLPTVKSQITFETFYKDYNNYPFSVKDSVSLASKGADYGVYGDEEVKSKGTGRAYGFEIFGRSKDILKFNAVFSYTFVRSEFKDYNGKYIPASWDNRHLFTLTANRKFNKNWDLGFKWRFVGGAPYTPWDEEKSSYKEAWDAQGQGYLDYSKYNEERLDPFHQLDLRVDKGYFYNKWSLMFYLDIQNIYNFKADQPDYLIRVTDDDGVPITDPDNPDKYVLKTVESSSGTILPTIGIMVEF
jgi:outer membrane receptor for ferrienterochelin and colicin